MPPKITQSFHFLAFSYISLPHPSQSQSGLYNHYSTYLTHPLLFLPLCGWLLYAVFLQIFSPTVGKKKGS
jgi:hypothetical protein